MTLPVQDAPPRTIYRAPDGTDVIDCHPREVAQLLADGGPLWVDIDSTVRSQHALLEKVFRFHPLAIEDTLNPNSRVKLEEYAGYLFIIIRGVRFAEQTEDPYDLETKDLYCFLGPRYLVTVHAGPLPAIDRVSESIRRSPELLSRGVERALHAILDETIDSFFPCCSRSTSSSTASRSASSRRSTRRRMRDIFTVKRLVLSLRRYLQPSREVMNVLTNRPSSLLTPDAQIYFRDIYDHVLRINDALDTYRELLSSTMDSYLTQVSNRLATSTKGLSLVATMSLPFVVVSGMWGMNFSQHPAVGVAARLLGAAGGAAGAGRQRCYTSCAVGSCLSGPRPSSPPEPRVDVLSGMRDLEPRGGRALHAVRRAGCPR